MTELGDLIREYRGSPWRFISAAILSGVMTIGAIWAIAEMKPKDPGAADMVALLFGVITIVFGIMASRDRASRLSLHQHGVLYERGGTRKSVRYDEIAAARETRINGKAAVLRLELRRGGEVLIGARLGDYEHAAQTIAAAI